MSLLAVWLGIGALLALLLVGVRQDQVYSAQQSTLIRWWMRRLLSILGVTLVHNRPSTAPVWVANHISWVDIIALMAIEPSRFLSKAEVASWPIIGWLARRVGTLFIQRGAHQAQKATAQLAVLLQMGDRVVFFPEGTSQGGMPQKFHARLFALPIQEQVSVAPIALRYQDQSQRLRGDLSYTGDQTFMQNLWYLLQQKGITLRVTFMPDISSVGVSRNDLSDACQGAVTCGFQSAVGEV